MDYGFFLSSGSGGRGWILHKYKSYDRERSATRNDDVISRGNHVVMIKWRPF